MIKLNIITVGYNEEINLPKLFKSLEYIKSKINIRHIYVDQSSNDNSLNIAKENGCETYLHDNKGYADPDKKWIVETLLDDEDWCLILDCDEELTKKLSDEIIKNIKDGIFNVFKIKLKTYLLGNAYVVFNQLRLFQKKSIIISDEIHNYLKTKNKKIKNLNNYIINRDNKDNNKNIFNHINKINNYSESELKKFKDITKYKIFLNIFIMPSITFFHWYIINKLIFHGLAGFIISINMSFYTFTIYSKLYENSNTTN